MCLTSDDPISSFDKYTNRYRYHEVRCQRLLSFSEIKRG
nr:MAG TPA_asm: hypothetical protein [Caudoviricetes sp.]